MKGILAELKEDRLKQPSKTEMKSALRGADILGYLVTSPASVVDFIYRKTSQAKERAAVIVRRHDRHLELALILPAKGPLLTDEARNQIADYLIAASLPGGAVIVSNQRALATRIGFTAGYDLAAFLRSIVEDEENLEPGRAREYARVEANKRMDGSVFYRQRGITRSSVSGLKAG